MSDLLLHEVIDSLHYDPGNHESAAIVTNLAAFVKNDILTTYGAPMFFARVDASLRASGIGRPFRTLLMDLRSLSNPNHPQVQLHMMEHGTFLAIREAVDRESLQGQSDYEHYAVLREALCIYRFVQCHVITQYRALY